ncbi:hypothetical protein BGZ98_006918 [Dissophora globulifera]|nr:hypothetical protein BGZ98_006918 [Dissophora globulifera]
MASIALFARTRPTIRCLSIYMLMLLVTLCNFMTAALPVAEKKPSSGNDDNLVGNARSGPYNLTVQGGIAGAILIVLGLVLCFFGARFFRITMFLIGFYFFANIAYVGMANGGVTSSTLLLIISIVVGILGGLLLSGGVITSHAGRGILLGVLAVVGFIVGFIREHETVIVGTALVGAYSVVAGIDFYAHTGFIQQTDSFINSKNSIDNRVGNLSGPEYGVMAAFIVLAILGMVVQFHWWGRRNFRPVAAARPAGSVVYTEKPSRFGGIFRRRQY